MKTHSISRTALPCLLALAFPATAGQGEQRLSFTPGSSSTWNAAWTGETGPEDHRVWFLQWSLNLTEWHYAPFLEFGPGAKNFGMDTGGEPKFFVRLRYGDFPEIDNLEEAMAADFDNDGVSNLFEVTNNLNPLVADSTGIGIGVDGNLDPDGDGLGNAAEQAAGADPVSKDHPLLALEVTLD